MESPAHIDRNTHAQRIASMELGFHPHYAAQVEGEECGAGLMSQHFAMMSRLRSD
jgi:hypothetical protein